MIQPNPIALTTTAAAVARAEGTGRVRVWDPLVRLVHWSLATAVLIAFLTEDERLALHLIAGYTALALIAGRLLWGFFGTRHARWSDFVRDPREVFAYLAAALRGRAPRYLGHNPAGGAMVIALMLAVSATGVSGLAVFGAQELSGPLAPMLSDLPNAWGHWLEEVHEVLANLTLLLILTHVAGVLFSSLSHRENLIAAMITGWKRRAEP